jgi:hypothetical protein
VDCSQHLIPTKKFAFYQLVSTENILHYLDGSISFMRLFALLAFVLLGIDISAQQKYPEFSVTINKVNFDAKMAFLIHSILFI